MNRRRVLAALGAGLMGTACSRTKPVLVGSKNGAEPELLGEIAALLIEQHLKAGVARHLDMGRTSSLHQAMMMGEIDLYPEYTGAAHSEILKAAPTSDAAVVFERVKLDYHNQFRMEWLDPLGFNASYVMVVPAADPRFQAISTISAVQEAKLPLRLAMVPEFLSRPDGNASLVKTYDLELKLYSQAGDATAPLYRTLADRRADAVIGKASDGALLDSRWKILIDDRSAFLPNQPCLVVRSDAFARYPELRELLSRLSGKISNEEIRKLNRKLDAAAPRSNVAAELLASARLT